MVRVGGGAREAGRELVELLDLVDGVAVTSPLASGVIPYAHPRNMTVGGSKGSICGNYAMEEADLLIAVGSRSVCQSDSSRTNYPKVRRVISVNTNMDAAIHYNRTIPLVGDAALTLRRLIDELHRRGAVPVAGESSWLRACGTKRQSGGFQEGTFRNTHTA